MQRGRAFTSYLTYLTRLDWETYSNSKKKKKHNLACMLAVLFVEKKQEKNLHH